MPQGLSGTGGNGEFRQNYGMQSGSMRPTAPAGGYASSMNGMMKQPNTMFQDYMSKMGGGARLRQGSPSMRMPSGSNQNLMAAIAAIMKARQGGRM